MKRNLMKEAHKLTKEIKEQYPEVDYQAQLGLCLSFLAQEKEITLESLEEAAESYIEEEYNCEGGWYVKSDFNNWQKGKHNRTYISIKEYRKGSLRKTIKCGYWDHNTNEYVTFDRYSRVLNLLTREMQ